MRSYAYYKTDIRLSKLPLNVITGTNETRVYNLCGESSSSFRLRDNLTLMRNGTCLNKN